MTLSDVLGNVTFLERPFHPITFISVAQTALKTRHRQYEARARIEELHEGEERLRTALLAGRLGTFELDLATWTLAASATCKALFGRTTDQPFTYEDLVESTHPDDRARVQERVSATIEMGTDYAVEHRICLARWKHPLGRNSSAARTRQDQSKSASRWRLRRYHRSQDERGNT